MTSTVTAGELKIIEANVRGISNKELHVKNFLQRRKKKTDIFCIVEHKATQTEKLLEQFAAGSYKVGASNCRKTGGPGGGVALLVHEKLTNVQDAENKFKAEFDVLRQKGIEIAAIELRLTPKDCQPGLFVFGVYRRPNVLVPDFFNIICKLIKKVNGPYNSTAVFTGDFNINNNKEAQKTRSNKVNELLIGLHNMGYRLTHTKPSHALGSTLNNFLVPKNMKYHPPKNLDWGFKIPYRQSKQKPVKEPDHFPIQIIVTLENPRSPAFLTNSQRDQRQGNLNFNINASSTSGNQTKRRCWSEQDGVITILDDSEDDEDDEESTRSQPAIPIASSSDQNQPQMLYHSLTGQDVTITRVKTEGESRTSQLNPPTVSGNRHSVSSNNSSSQVLLQDTPFLNQSSSCNQQPERINILTVIDVTDGPKSSQINEHHNPSNTLSFVTTHGPLQPSLAVQDEINHSNIVRAEKSVLLVTPESTYREVQTVRPEPSRHPTGHPAPYPQVQGTNARQLDLLRQLDDLNRMESLRKRELQVLSELTEIEQKRSKVMAEMNKK